MLRPLLRMTVFTALFSLSSQAFAEEDSIWTRTWDYWAPKIEYQTKVTTDYWAPKIKYQTKVTTDYWAPKIKYQTKVTTDYWGPKVKRQAKITMDYWEPKVSYQAKVTKDYWDPKIESHLKSMAAYWLPLLDRKVHPFFMDNYKFLNDKYGEETARVYSRTRDFWAPHVSRHWLRSKSYWTKNYPEFFDELYQTPALLKKGMDAYVIWSMTNLAKAGEAVFDEIPSAAVETAKMVSGAVVSEAQEEDALAQILLEELRPFVYDQGMKGCYKARVYPSDIENAFNTGCHVFIATSLIEGLNRDEIRAVIAHELSHGDLGHALKNMWNMAYVAGEHLSLLIGAEMKWLLTGEVTGRFAEVMDEGNLMPMMAAFSESGPKQELEADLYAIRILHRAGFDPRAARSALIKLHSADPETIFEEKDETYEGLRDYPSLRSRVQATDAELKRLGYSID